MINNSEQQQRLIGHFPFLAEATESFRREFFAQTTLIHVPQGHTIATDGSACNQLALVLDGTVRVYKMAASGREITLYRINDGDSCILTASCIMSHTPFPAIAVSESDLDALIIPAKQARDWLTQSQPWCSFVFGLVSKRLADVIAVLESVAFQRMDIRISTYLIELAAKGKTVFMTHHEIAAELGTSREVVSRILKEFMKRGWVKVSRGEIEIIKLDELEKLAQGL